MGLRATGINNVGLILKKERPSGNFMRYRLAVANLGFVILDDVQVLNANLAAAVGFERRKVLTDRLDLLLGPEPFVSVANISGNGGTSTSLTAGLGYVVGLNYLLSDRFRVGFELIPRASFSLTNNGGVTVTQFGVGVSSSNFAVVAVYNFTAGNHNRR